jgi:hypothetical protein
VDVGGRRDRQVDRPPAGASSSLYDRRREASPFATDRGVDGDRVERRLDDTESLRTPRALVGVAELVAPSRSAAAAEPISTDASSRSGSPKRIREPGGEPLEILGEALRRSRSRRGPRLVEVLDRGIQGPVTVIAAPARGGKTTLVSSWLRGAELPGPPACVSVERDESDATRFWGTVIESLRPVQVTYSGLWHTASALLPSGSST